MKTVKLSDSGVYWCGAKHGGSSDGVNITVSGGPLILQSPLSPVVPGANVSLVCKSRNFTSDPARFWKDNTIVTETSTHRMPHHMTLPNVSSSDQSSYTCSFSGSRKSPPTWLLLQEDAEPPPLTIQPDSIQAFEYRKVTLSCGDWTVVRASTETRTLQTCGDLWGTPTSSGCTIYTTKKSDSGVYWCESTSKRRSNSINFYVHGGPVILQSPVLPVDQGQNVTLSCQAKTSDEDTLPADFYKDGSFIGAGPEGHMTLLHVSKADEGKYSCSIRDQGQSPPSWMSVSGHGSVDMYGGAMTPLRLLCHLVVFCPYCISTVLMVSLCRRRGGSMAVSMEMTPPSNAADDQSADDVTTEHRF
ncbi:uncharacterized protein V6R79_018121 [Siganus canaliculatus]